VTSAATVSVPIVGPLVRATFLERPNRFVLVCRLEAGDVVRAHLPDPGRLRELLMPGAPVWLRPAPAAGSPPSPAAPPSARPGFATRRRATAARTTAWTAVLTACPAGGLVSIDTGVPNRLTGEALRRGALAEFAGWELERAEWPLGRSRLDFLLRRGGERLGLEVKSVTLVEEGVALFPDAVTARGARHLRELAELAARPAHAAAVLFLAQRADARRIHAAAHIDPVFAAALAEARQAGVRVLGRSCEVTLERVVLGPPIPAG
jgi:sugar fermentation stimulation protein A